MGIFADTCEDSAERYGQWCDRGTSFVIPSREITVCVRERLHQCPICLSQYTSLKTLHSHIFGDHSGRFAYVAVNGKVFSHQIVHLTEDVEEMAVHTSETPREPILLTVKEQPGSPGQAVSVICSETVTALAPYLKNKRPYSVRIKIPGHRDFEICFDSSVELDFAALDSVIEELENELITAPNSVDWREWSSRFSSETRSVPRGYLDGHYDYLLGYWYESVYSKSNLVEAASRYAEAYGRLASFASPKATATCKAIALRMNWFDLMEPKDKGSIFYFPGLFFSRTYEEFQKALHKRPSKKSVKSCNARVLLDDFSSMLVTAVTSFYKGVQPELISKLRSLRGNPQCQFDKNQEAKILLMEARYYRMAGNQVEALSRYEELEGFCDFGEEAEEFRREYGSR